MKSLILNGQIRNDLRDYLENKHHFYDQFHMELNYELEQLKLIRRQFEPIPDIGGNLVSFRLYDEQLEFLTSMLQEDIDWEIARRENGNHHDPNALPVNDRLILPLGILKDLLFRLRHAR